MTNLRRVLGSLSPAGRALYGKEAHSRRGGGGSEKEKMAR